MIKADIHLHTLLSDGRQHPEEVMRIMGRYIQKGTIDLFGISDHYKRHPAFPLRDNIELRNYINYLRRLRDFQTYFDPRRMKIGIEVYSFRGIPHITEENLNMLDYILIEYVENRIEELLEWRKNIEKPVGLSHPIYECLLPFRDDIASADVFLELNGIKPTYRKCPQFFQGMPSELRFSIGSDMHNFFSRTRNTYIEAELTFAEELGLPLVTDNWL